MNPKSASTLVWAAAAATLIGLIIMSPSGQFFSFLVAAILATAPGLFGPKRVRIAAGVILAFSIAFACKGYPAFHKEMGDYRKRAAARSSKVPATTAPGPQQENK